MSKARGLRWLAWIARLTAVAMLIVSPGVASAEPKGPPDFVDGELLLKFLPGSSPAEIETFFEQERLTVLRHFDLVDLYQLQIPGALPVPAAVHRLSKYPLLEYVVPNSLYYLDATYPNDPQFGSLWGLNNTGQTGGTPDADIDAPEAWDITTGSASVVVAIIDSGITFNHPDLAANIYTNPGEIAGNRIDDDGNGYVDDVHGWDTVGWDNDPSDVSGACGGHGTHVAGTIGALGDNADGVAGVNWHVQLLPIRAFKSTFRRLCSATEADLIEAIQYQTSLGVRISSNSWGGSSFSAATRDAIRASRSLFVAAAGNNGRNNDGTPTYPASYPLPNIVAVAATDANDARAGFSNYGPLSVDLAAPGVNILSTLPTGYGQYSGTSMATPHVAGAAALLLAQDPGLTTNELKWRLVHGVDPLGLPLISGGRLNAYGSLAFGLAPLAVGVEVAPLGPTNVPMGGTFQYRVTLTNNRAEAIEAQLIVFGRSTSGSTNGMELVGQGPSTIALGAGQSWQADFSQALPPNFTGSFELIGSAETAISFDEAAVSYHVP